MIEHSGRSRAQQGCLPGKVARFWGRFAEALARQGVKASTPGWYVVRAEHVERSSQSPSRGAEPGGAHHPMPPLFDSYRAGL